MMSELFDPNALRGPAKRRFATVSIEGLGNVRIRSLTELERSRLEASMRDKRGNLNTTKQVEIKCRVIVAAVVDEEGNQVFTNSDIAQLGQQDSKITNELVEAIQAHCGWSDDDLEDLEKN